MLKIFLIVLFAGLSSALVVGPAIYEQANVGDSSLPEFTYSLSADCNASTITGIIMDQNNVPVSGAQTYLKYIDFVQPLLSAVQSDKDGYVLHKLPGQVTLMRGLFILVIEKHGYQNKEIHFDLYPCLHNGELPPKPPPPPPPPQENITYTVIEVPQKNSTPPLPANKTKSNLTISAPAPAKSPPPFCPAIPALGILLATKYARKF